MDGFEDILKEFVVESQENLNQLDDDLLALEDEPENRERIASIFRTVHTIKGTSGFLALPKLERVTHVGENLLVPIRDGQLELNRPITNVLLEMVDAIRAILRHVEQGQGEGDDDYDSLVDRLEAALNRDPGADDPSADPSSVPSPDHSATVDTASQVKPTDTSSAPPRAYPADTEFGTAVAKPTQPITDASVRIDVGLLDKLMNLVGELVLARNQIIQFSSRCNDAEIIDASQRLNAITSELQENVMKTRMQPIRHAWSSLPRMVRDLAGHCGKQVAVQTEGDDTEIDKTVLEAIRGPLTHIVRNAVDHGIELPDERLASGKPRQGRLWMRAFHEGGQVIIEVSDDGVGIDVEQVAKKAIENEIVTPQQVDVMTNRELTNLILLPGFSTATTVTNLSGRGVGMDVVKTNVESIGGSLEIQSELGSGTTLRIRIPLTLAIIPALLIKSGDAQYAIPQISLLELVRVDRDRANRVIEFIHEAPVFRLREKLLPLVFLDEQLGLHEPRQMGDPFGNLNIVVLRADDQPFGLVVNEITDTQEIVVKPLSFHLQQIAVYAGATIMGDGSVSLILDVVGIAEKSGVLNNRHDHQAGDQRISASSSTNSAESLLIIDSARNARAAIRLSSVARLEKFSIADVECAEGKYVVQYRGQVIPLVALDGALQTRLEHCNSRQTGQTARLHTVVYHEGNQCIGIVVDRIVDIIQKPSLDDEDADASKTQLIHNRVTEIIDLPSFIANAMSNAMSNVNCRLPQ